MSIGVYRMQYFTLEAICATAKRFEFKSGRSRADHTLDTFGSRCGRIMEYIQQYWRYYSECVVEDRWHD